MTQAGGCTDSACRRCRPTRLGAGSRPFRSAQPASRRSYTGPGRENRRLRRSEAQEASTKKTGDQNIRIRQMPLAMPFLVCKRQSFDFTQT